MLALYEDCYCRQIYLDAKLAGSQSSKSTRVFGLVEQKTHCHLRFYLD